MVHLAESLSRIAILLKPFMTQTPKKIFEQLNIADEHLTSWESLETFGAIPEGTKVVEKGEPIFPRLDMEEEIDYIKDTNARMTPAPEEEGRTENEEEENNTGNYN